VRGPYQYARPSLGFPGPLFDDFSRRIWLTLPEADRKWIGLSTRQNGIFDGFLLLLPWRSNLNKIPKSKQI
jgi:hypothetical protein